MTIRMTLGRRIGIAVLALALVAACAPRFEMTEGNLSSPVLAATGFHTADGTVLAVTQWLPEAPPKAVIVALHGFNDYRNAFAGSAAFWRRHGIATYAYDQRGFGESRDAGRWPGTGALVRDLDDFVALIRDRHPKAPVYILGDSMGGAVAMLAATRANAAQAATMGADGIVLAAPALWSRAAMNLFQRFGLWLSARLTPWARVSGRGLGIKPSDNIEMLRALSKDPLVIKKTRIDAVYGLVDLMDAAFDSAARFDFPALILYGAHDEIIPAAATRRALKSLPAAARNRQRIAVYEDGYHMLLRDLQADTVRADIAAWIAAREAPLPSGADDRAAAFLTGD